MERSTICIDGEKFIDSGGGFLLQENVIEKEQKVVNGEESNFDTDNVLACLECRKEFLTSYLYQTFRYTVCDACRDSDGKHSLITRTEAKGEFLLKDCDLDSREPSLRYILRKNPHNLKWGQMKLYLLQQVEKRALEVWGSIDNLKREHKLREEKRLNAKDKQYNRKLKSLRMAMRSSLYDRTSGPSHHHEFGNEKYDNKSDIFSRKCITCSFVETYEKM